MKIEHHGSPCIHCGATSSSEPMCKLHGKPIAIGEHQSATADRAPFRSFMDDLDGFRARLDELAAERAAANARSGETP